MKSPSSSLTDISNGEINEWVKKTNALQRTIKKIAEGTLDPDKASLKKYGILTPEEKAEEEATNKVLRLEREERRAHAKAEEKRRERENWWNGAVLLYGPAAADITTKDAGILKIEEGKGSTKCNEIEKLPDKKIRYSSDYGRWSDQSFQPNDPATKEETEERKRQKENARNKEFEARNQKFCVQFTEDAEKRKENEEKKNQSAVKSRLKGNAYYKKKKYGDALQCYAESTRVKPYATNVLMNTALCYSKLLQYDDAEEYCNRVLYVDKRYLKALFHRATIYRKLKKDEEALRDINNALEIDPANEEILAFYDSLKQDAMDRDSEKLVESVTVGGKHNELYFSHLDADSENCVDIVGLFAQLYGENIDAKQQLGNVCKIVGFLMQKKIRQGAISEGMKFYPSDSAFGSSPPLSHVGVDDRFTFGSFFVFLLQEFPLAQVYVRKSGILDELSREACSLSAKGPSEEGSILFDIISACIRSEKRSKRIVMEHGVIRIALKTVNAQTAANSEIAYRVAVSGLMDSFLAGISSCTSLPSSTLPTIIEFIEATSLLLVDLSKLSDLNLALLKWRGAKLCASVLQTIATDKNMRLSLEESFFTIMCCDEANLIPAQHPMGSILTMLITSPGKQSPPPNEVMEAREMLVGSLVAFSTIPKFREYFTRLLKIEKNGSSIKEFTNAVGVLLAISQSPKTDTETCRVSSLIALFNATIVSSPNKSNNKVKDARKKDSTHKDVVNAIQQCNGINTLVALCTSDENTHSNTPWSVMQRASSLLSRCVSCLHEYGSSQLKKLSIDNRVVAIEAFVKMNLKKPWNNFAEGNETRSLIMEISANLIRVIASDPLDLPTGYALVNYVRALIESLPSPATSERGKVTASSVCLPPKVEVGSFYEFAILSTTFQGNIIKALIACIDKSEFIDEEILHEDIIEKLVCVIANSSRMHKLAVKNAASAVARIVKRNEAAMARCRELRGIEMIVALGKSGDV